MNTFSTYPLYDPAVVRESRTRFRRDALPALAYANSVHIPAGRWPLRGWFLIARSNYNNLDKYARTHTLEIGDPLVPNNVSKLQGLSIVQARCVTRGLAADANALYLVEVTDARGVLCNQWFQHPTTYYFLSGDGNPMTKPVGYNARAPAYPGLYYSGTLDSGTAWSWTTLLADLWGTMSTFLGAWPGLPAGVTITGTPEGFWFPGTASWPALNDILDYLGLAVAHNPASATPYTLVKPGADDTSFTDLTNKYVPRLEDDLEWIDTGAGRIPGTVHVLFRRRNEVYGTEETVRRDAFQWSTTPVYVVSVSAPATFTGATGVHYLWSDFTVRQDINGATLAADTATATTIAQERVIQYFARIYRQTLGFMNRVYTGALPFVTGSQVDGVRYYQDYSSQGRQGWKTEIVRGPCPPWPEVYGVK